MNKKRAGPLRRTLRALLCLAVTAAAFALCAENHVPMVRVFGLAKPERLLEVLQGSDAGTFVHP